MERDAAIDVLHGHDTGQLSGALLAEGDTDLAWTTANQPDADIGLHQWVSLADARATTHPAECLPIYWRAVNDVLQSADRRNYARAVTLIERICTLGDVGARLLGDVGARLGQATRSDLE